MANSSAHGAGNTPFVGEEHACLLANLVDQLPDAILCVNREWRITYMNPEAMRLGRQTPRTFGQGTFWDHYPDLVDTGLGQSYRRVMKTKEPYHTSFFYEPFQVWIDLHVLATEEGIALYYRDITATKQAEAARDASQSQLQQVLETTTDAIMSLDRHFNMVYFNQRAKDLLAASGDVLGKNLWETFPWAVYEGSPFMEHYNRGMSEGVSGQFEAYYPEPFNFWLSVQVRPSDEGIIVFFRDITQQRRDREIVRWQQKLLTETQQLARVATWEVDLATGAVVYTPGSFPVYGHPLESMTTLAGFEACVYPPHMDRIHAARALAQRSREGVSNEFQVVTAEGKLIWVESRFHLVEVDGQPTHLRGLTIDITERKHADEMRESAIRRLGEVMETTTEGIVSLDRDWTITYMNPRARMMTVPAGDYTGENFWAVFPQAQGTRIEQEYRRAMDARMASQFENFYSAPGYRRWYLIDVRPSEAGIIIFLRDITLEKTAKEALQQQQELLAAIQQDVHAAIWNADLRTGAFTFHPGSYPVFGRPNPEIPNLETLKTLVCDPEALDRELQAVIESGETLRHEWQMLPPDRSSDSTAVWVESRCAAVYENGEAVGLRGIAVDITEEREARAKLAEERATLAFAHQTAHAASWELDFHSRRLTFAPGSYPVMGRPLDSIASMDDFFAILHPDDRARILAIAAVVRPPGEVMVKQFRVLGDHGQVLWLESRSQVFYRDDKPVSLRGMTIDIGERKRDEVALAASEERYRVLTELNPQAIWMGAPDGRITYANQGFLDYIGLTLDDLGNWLNAFDPLDRPVVLATWLHCVGTGENYDIEARILRGSDGASRWWWLRAQPVRDASGAVLHWLGVAMDIHDRRSFADALLQKQEETERQRAELETLYTTAPIGLALFDPVEFRYLRLNQRQAEFFGLQPEDILGKTLTELAPIPGLRELFEQVRDGRPIINHLLEGELANQPGVHRYWTVNYFPVYDAHGKVQAISAASLEITPQKRAESALIQSEKLAAVGRLATSISHEINNPLEAITNLLYLVASGTDLSDETRLYVSMAQSELARVCQIATQTLRFHRQAVGPTNVSAKTLVTAVLNLYQGRLTNSGIKVESKFSTDTRILCFENDIRQVLNNLISNAIDAMKRGGRLVVRSHNTILFQPGSEEPRRGIRITIADTGHGMTPEVLARVFEAFYTTKDLNGTGLGLWISDGIVKRHQGLLSVRSSTRPENHGTIFTLFLPEKESNPAEA